MDSNANSESMQSSLNSMPFTASTASKNAAADSQSEMSIASEHEDISKTRTVNISGVNGTHQSATVSMDSNSSLEKGEAKKPEDLTVHHLRNSLIQMMKDADLGFFQRAREGGLGDRIGRLARDQLNDQATLLAYVDHLEKTVEFLTGNPKITDSSTPGSPRSEVDAEEPTIEQSNPWKVEVKRWKEVRSEDDAPVLIDDASTSKENQNQGSKRSGHVLISYRECNPDKTHTTTRLEVNSSLLIDTLQKVITDYPADALKMLLETKVVFYEPFMMIFHQHKKLREEHSRLEGEAKEHLGLLLEFVEEQWPRVGDINERIDQKAIKEIGYNEIWLLYSPGTIIYTKEDEEWRAYRVNKIGGFHRLGEDLFTSLQIECHFWCLDTFGTKLEATSRVVNVSYYSGTQAIRDLEFVPAGYMPEETSIREALIARGQRYWDYRDKGHFQNYTGTAWLTATPKDGHRVMIDHSTNSRRPRIDSEYDLPGSILSPRALAGCFCSRCTKARGPSGRRTRRRRYRRLHEDSSDDEDDTLEKSRRSGRFGISDAERLLCCSSEVSAFSLRDRTWRSVNVSQLGPVKFRDDAFKKLVIKGKHKTVVKAMVRSYVDHEPTSGDLIQGKGRGLVVLLHGSPGTGKTLTAECVAEKENRPLYMVTCGDLGTEPDVLEKRLKDTFEYAVNWNAVLLLDEADVFLQERDVHDLKRNALVSVFLRELEYFDGVLFLTTNRPGSLDEAFQSRIHITIGLPELDPKSQLEVWTIFVKDLDIEKAEKVDILRFVDEDIKRNGNLNGRQIRNAVRTALAIAAQKGQRISKDHVRDVLEIGRDFTKYLDEVNRMNQEQRAVALGHRAQIAS